MNAADSPAQAPLSEDEIDALQQQLDAVPAPLEPLDVSALDGYLCGVLLQPTPVAASAWLPGVTDVEVQVSVNELCELAKTLGFETLVTIPVSALKWCARAPRWAANTRR